MSLTPALLLALVLALVNTLALELVLALALALALALGIYHDKSITTCTQTIGFALIYLSGFCLF